MAASPGYLTTIRDDPVGCVCPLCGHGLGPVEKLVGFIGACSSPNSSLMRSLTMELREGEQTFIFVGGVGELKKSQPHNSFLRFNKGVGIVTTAHRRISDLYLCLNELTFCFCCMLNSCKYYELY
ncbi:hypothetical protein QAD02_003172 [Eretmocerus hayati]|uniref:Uncharacterized protein n=1 Tax=Eretmocerus hayati TaxID=131215 RepID=A0ACC2NM89_9HYME|nr:hypothetical protein QAD02_003172 [Eretmocerus hayati]